MKIDQKAKIPHLRKIKILSSNLKLIEVEAFFQIRITLKQKFFVLTNNKEIYEKITLEEYITENFLTLIKRAQPGKLAISFMENGVSFALRLEEYIDIFCFMFVKEISKNMILDRLDLLKRFIIYFRTNAEREILDITNNHMGSLRQCLLSPSVPQNQSIDPLLHFKRKLIPKSLTYKGLKFSPQETKILFGLLACKSGSVVATELNLSKRTVDFYLENIKAKTGCHTRLELLDFIKALHWEKGLFHERPH